MNDDSDLKNLPSDLLASLRELGEYDEETLKSFAEFPVSFDSTSLNPDPESRAEAARKELEMKSVRKLLKGKDSPKDKPHSTNPRKKQSPQLSGGSPPDTKNAPKTRRLSSSPTPTRVDPAASFLIPSDGDRSPPSDTPRVGLSHRQRRTSVCACGSVECARGGQCALTKKVLYRSSEDVPPPRTWDRLAKLKEFVNGDNFCLLPARELMETTIQLITASGDLDLMKHWELHSHHYAELMTDHKTNFLQRLLRELSLGAPSAAASLRGYLIGREYSEMEVTREKLDRYESMVADLEVYMKGVKDSQENHNAQIRKLCDQVNNASSTIANIVKGAESLQLAVNKLDTIPRPATRLRNGQEHPVTVPPRKTKPAFTLVEDGPSREPVLSINGDGGYVTETMKIRIENSRLVSIVDETNTLEGLKILAGKHVSLVRIILSKSLQNLRFAFDTDPRWLQKILDATPEEAKVKLLAFHRQYPDHPYQWSRTY